MDANVIAAKIAVDGIIKDLKGRWGLDNEWNSIDKDIQEEIKDQWTLIVLNAMDN
jgi:hypothetical protein